MAQHGAPTSPHGARAGAAVLLRDLRGYNTRRWLTYWPNLTGEDPATAPPKPKMFPEGRAALVAVLEKIKATEANLPIGAGSAASFALADCRAVLLAALKQAE